MTQIGKHKSFIKNNDGTFSVKTVRENELHTGYVYTIEVDPNNVGKDKNGKNILLLRHDKTLATYFTRNKKPMTFVIYLKDNHIVNVLRGGKHKVLIKVAEGSSIIPINGIIGLEEDVLFKQGEIASWHNITEIAKTQGRRKYKYTLL